MSLSLYVQDVMVLNFFLTVGALWTVKKNDDFLFMNELFSYISLSNSPI